MKIKNYKKWNLKSNTKNYFIKINYNKIKFPRFFNLLKQIIQKNKIKMN